NVDSDNVSLFNQPNRTAHCSLWTYMPHSNTSRYPAKPAIRDQGSSDSHSHNGCCRVEHFFHSRSAFRPLISNYNNISVIDFSAEYCLLCFFRHIKYPCLAFESQPVLGNSAFFHHRSFRRQITEQNGNPTFFAVGVFHAAYDVRPINASILNSVAYCTINR